MKVYIDKDYKCHVENDGTMTLVETDFFNDKCAAFIEGYRFVPSEKTWVDEDGTIFVGEMIAPWKDYGILKTYQEQYEAMLTEQENIQAALNILVGE